MLWNGFALEDLTKESCALEQPDVFNALLRPIDDCDMCLGLERIEHLEHITQKKFIKKYAYTSVPVVIRNALTNWTALNVLSFDFLKEVYRKADEMAYRDRQEQVTRYRQWR